MKQPKLKMLFQIIEKTIPRCENFAQVEQLRNEIWHLYISGHINKERYDRWTQMLDSVSIQ